MIGLSMLSGGSASFASIKLLEGNANVNAYSILLDGANDFLTQPDGDNLFHTLGANASSTLSFYIKPGALNSTIFWKGTYPSNYAWWYLTSGGDLKLQHNSNTGTVLLAETFNTNLSAGTWYHIVITTDGSATNRVNKCYVNGSEISANNSSTVASSVNLESHTGTALFTVGTLANLAFYSHHVDQMATWNAALSAANILEIYRNNPNLSSNSGDYTSAGRLQRYLKMEAGSGTSANDLAGNGNAAMTLVNGASWSTDKPW